MGYYLTLFLFAVLLFDTCIVCPYWIRIGRSHPSCNKRTNEKLMPCWTKMLIPAFRNWRLFQNTGQSVLCLKSWNKHSTWRYQVLYDEVYLKNNLNCSFFGVSIVPRIFFVYAGKKMSTYWNYLISISTNNKEIRKFFSFR